MYGVSISVAGATFPQMYTKYLQCALISGVALLRCERGRGKLHPFCRLVFFVEIHFFVALHSQSRGPKVLAGGFSMGFF